MDADSWARLSKRHQPALQSRYDLYLAMDEMDGGHDEGRAEFACPFCAEDFDIVGLCCHIDDEHPVEAQNGVCPVCADRVGPDMVGHITTQHGSIFKMQRRRRSRKSSSGPQSALFLLRKELREGNLQSLSWGASFTTPTNSAPDPLLSSFITNMFVADPFKDVQAESLDEASVANENLDEKEVASTEPRLSDKDQQERAQRSEFVQEILFSTIFLDV